MPYSFVMLILKLVKLISQIKCYKTYYRDYNINGYNSSILDLHSGIPQFCTMLTMQYIVINNIL